MTDQKFLALRLFPFLIENFPTGKKSSQFLKKVKSLVHFVNAFSKAWFFGIIYPSLPKDSSKMNE